PRRCNLLVQPEGGPGAFFFQAEDGIRDLIVTGVQTCALPISPQRGEGRGEGCKPALAFRAAGRRWNLTLALFAGGEPRELTQREAQHEANTRPTQGRMRWLKTLR